MADIRRSYYLFGDYGRGKTHLLFAQYGSLLPFRRCIVRTTKQIVDELIADDLGKTASPLRNALESGGKVHLFWDDIDKLKVSDYKLEVLYDLVDRIYRYSHFMTVTSNLSLEHLQDTIGSATMRRVCDICAVVRV
jgi:DNA replication protein DnaC